MKFSDKLVNLVRAKPMSRGRMTFALTVAVVADGLQLMLGPLGWAGTDQIIDLVAMILTSLTLGFHFLLMPTFVVEFIPVVDMLPTWTACTAAVIALRKRAERASMPPPVDVELPKLEEPPKS